MKALKIGGYLLSLLLLALSWLLFTRPPTASSKLPNLPRHQQREEAATPKPIIDKQDSKPERRYLRWEDDQMIAEWNAQAPAASYRWKIEWVLKEIFGGVKLPTSARDFGNDGFRMGAADAAKFLEDLKKAVKYTDDYFAKQKYDEDLFEEVSFYNAHREFPDSTLQGLKHGKNTIVITLIPKVDPDNPPKNYPDKRPMYIFGVNLDNGDIGFSDYPKD